LRSLCSHVQPVPGEQHGELVPDLLVGLGVLVPETGSDLHPVVSDVVEHLLLVLWQQELLHVRSDDLPEVLLAHDLHNSLAAVVGRVPARWRK
jgi:hypothetical protein